MIRLNGKQMRGKLAKILEEQVKKEEQKERKQTKKNGKVST